MEELTSGQKDKLKEIMDSIMNAITSETDYIAASEDQYFDFALHVIYYFEMVRVPPGIKKQTPDGRKFIMDCFRKPNGDLFYAGYETF